MLSIEDCRRYLGNTSLHLCDSDICGLREVFYASAAGFINNLRRTIKPVTKVFIEIDDDFYIPEELKISGAVSIKTISNNYLIREYDL